MPIPSVNRLKARLKEGTAAIGILQLIAHPALVEMQGFAGLDFVILDCEHGSMGPYGTTELENLIRAAELSQITPIVRVPENNPVMIARVLDAGAYGVVIPKILTAMDAEKAVQSIRYPLTGLRGGCPRVRATRYSFQEFSDYAKWVEEDVFIMLIIEDEQGIENLPEIVKVGGINAISIGWFDLSLCYGLGGNVTHERVSKTAKAATELILKHGMIVSRVARNLEQANELIREGVKIIQYTTDVSIFGDHCKEVMAKIKRG